MELTLEDIISTAEMDLECIRTGLDTQGRKCPMHVAVLALSIAVGQLAERCDP